MSTSQDSTGDSFTKDGMSDLSDSGWESQRITSNLCHYCAHALKDCMGEPKIGKNRERSYPHHSCVAHLWSSIDTYGCRLCWIIYQTVPLFKRSREHVDSDTERIIRFRARRFRWDISWETSPQIYPYPSITAIEIEARGIATKCVARIDLMLSVIRLSYQQSKSYP